MKIENLKIYGATLAIIAAMAMNPNNTMTVYAEEEVLFEDTEDDYTLEDIEETTDQPSNEDNSQENNQENEVPSTNPFDDNPEDDLENTEIDPEDEEYNTGRTEIPDYVKTEAERKGLVPDNPPTDSPSETLDDPQEEVPETPVTPVEPEVQPIPKTGASVNPLIGIGVALGLIGGSVIELQYLSGKNGLIKVIDSRKKYQKQNKKKTK